MTYCMNCGGNNVDVTDDGDKNAFLERGNYLECEEAYDSEQDVVVLKCFDCCQEMIQL